MEKTPKKEKSAEKISEKVLEEIYAKKKEGLETKEFEREEIKKIIKEKLKEELKKMETSPELKEEIKRETSQIEVLEKEGKIDRLLKMAEEKGLFFAVGVAKNMKDPYTLDAFHDILAKDNLYKKFLK